MESSYAQKKEIVINIILYERKQQAMKISSFLKNKINQNVKIKKYLLRQKILENILLIQKNFRGYIIRKKVTDYLSKIRTSYLIKSGIEENIKNLQMIVLFHNNKNKIFDFYYDKFFERFIFFMDRTKVQKNKYNIQFICDGRVIIDPQFQTTSDEKGMYTNVIDFNSVKSKENEHREKNNKLIRECCEYLKKNNLSVLPKSFVESYLNAEKNKNDGNYLYDDNEVTRSMKIVSSDSKMPRQLSSSLSNSTKFEMRAFKSFRKIPKLRGILKQSRRNMIKNNSDINQRRVSFGWREESF
jgi:hypothetical protein